MAVLFEDIRASMSRPLIVWTIRSSISAMIPKAMKSLTISCTVVD